jgi:aminopeptidase N
MRARKRRKLGPDRRDVKDVAAIRGSGLGLVARHAAARGVLVLLAILFLVSGCGRGGIAGDTTATASDQVAERGSPSGLGDEYFPLAGNSGYDVMHYDITLDCDPREGSLSGTTVIQAKALADLDEFHLDFVGLDIGSVQVNGVAADYRREGQELIVKCPTPLRTGSVWSVAVGYSGTPRAMTSIDGYPEGWRHSGDTIFTLDEPEGAAAWYPLNDHPSDKATYSFRLTVPKPYVAVANGILVSTRDNGQTSTFTWEMEQPMANYLAAVAAGDFVLEESVSPAGVPIRDYFAAELADTAHGSFENTGRALDYFSELFGPYPFAVYGVLVPDVSTNGAAMENQTMSLFGRDCLQKWMTTEFSKEMFMSHELAHQWFGNSVTPAEWKDIWLNEGIASYACWLWLEHEFGDSGIDTLVSHALASLRSPSDTLLGDPGAGELFGDVVYQRGALTMHSLRLTVGDDLFLSILRAWASEYAYGNATTEDFIDLVERTTGGVDGFDVRAFFAAWLYQEELPELPAVASTGK